MSFQIEAQALLTYLETLRWPVPATGCAARRVANMTQALRSLAYPFPVAGPGDDVHPRPGGPRPADARARRARRLKAAYYHRIERRSIRWVAARFRVSARTVCYWVRAVWDEDSPEAEALRRRARREE